MLFHAYGAVAIKRIVFVPAVAVTASDTNYWTIAVTNKGTAGGGSTSVVSTTTKAADLNGFTAFDAKAVYSPADELVVG